MEAVLIVLCSLLVSAAAADVGAQEKEEDPFNYGEHCCAYAVRSRRCSPSLSPAEVCLSPFHRLPKPADWWAGVCRGPVHCRHPPHTQQEVQVQFSPEAQSSGG